MSIPPNFLLINKPVGWTSFDVVGYVRKILLKSVILNEREGSLSQSPNGQRSFASAQDDRQKPKRTKVGHAGTLDPFATGLLIVGVGRDATKRLDEFKNLPKTYVATLRLGATSDTGDNTGKISETKETKPPDQKAVETALLTFIGAQKQTPPMHSAKSVGGVRLYKLARQGQVVERPPSAIEIYSIKLLDFSYPALKIEVTCSSGTYIRTLAEDIGAKLGVGAYCAELTRTKIGEYDLAQARDVAKLDIDNLLQE